MKAILLVQVRASGRDEDPPPEWLEVLSAALQPVFAVPCRLSPEPLDAAHAFDPDRNQYHSTRILEGLDRLTPDPESRVLGVTGLDLYVPVLTFVFGEAQLNGRCALVSTHRLREEFYGLPPRPDLLRERLRKEAVHELGHTFGLRHCSDWRCVMASSHAVERLDVKGSEYCPACRRVVRSAPALPLSPSICTG